MIETEGTASSKAENPSSSGLPSSQANKTSEPSQSEKPSKESTSEPVPAHKRGGVQLWQFLRQLLDNPDRRNIITWTRQGHDGEFKLLDPEEVARL